MAQPQSQFPQHMAPRAFSPQHSPSPSGMPQPAPQAVAATPLSMPSNKRPRTDSPANSQPTTPYIPSPYNASPAGQTPPSMASSPAPYSTLPALSLPSAVPTPTATPQPQTPFPNSAAPPGPMSTLNLPTLTPVSPITPTVPAAGSFTTATMALAQPPQAPQTPGAMGPPPSRPAPAERHTKEYEYDVSDSLAGTGIDLRAEEQFLADYYAGNFASDSRTGFPANAPGSKSSFYGAGVANQPAQDSKPRTHEQLVAETAEKAWAESAARLATSRLDEMKNPFLMLSLLHKRVEKIAKEHKLEVNLDTKGGVPTLGRMRQPQDFPSQPTVTVSTKVGPDGTMVTTTGSWIPHDAHLIDQLALLSIATKHRLHERLEDSYKLAVDRQASSHGEIPVEWADAAAPLSTAAAAIQGDPVPNRKRSFSAFAAATGSSHGQGAKSANLAGVMREVGKGDRSAEEERLRKRQRRLNPEAAAPASRAGSVAPGTPGSVAPEPDKAPTKGQKKNAAASRLAEASSTASANQTLAALMGGFGGKKKGKSYSWMMSSGGSGTSTPRPSAQPGGSSAAATPKPPEKTNLTQEGRYRLGTWREDGEKGKGVQLRDWVAALELEGIESRAIQEAYAKLDESAK
ncbi:hypothetical protein GQ53DRAFT_746521 [Thozetella sp. PMI_491]|nr:hypothetical protein GQ53DRAFT_746521 [Thozetella sp. PMI_491]